MTEDHAATVARLRRGLAYAMTGDPDAIVCLTCGQPLNNGEGHCGSNDCPACYTMKLADAKDDYPRTEPEEA